MEVSINILGEVGQRGGGRRFFMFVCFMFVEVFGVVFCLNK